MTDLERILPLWHELEASGADYVLATVVATEGSSYRKSGARMLLAQDGRRAGMVSGGCLEAGVGPGRGNAGHDCVVDARRDPTGYRRSHGLAAARVCALSVLFQKRDRHGQACSRRHDFSLTRKINAAPRQIIDSTCIRKIS